MKRMKVVISVILATLWISASEFVRNEFLLKSFWEEHYQSLGLSFPSEPVNGAVWGIWSLMFAVSIFLLSKKFTFFQTTFISWFMAFAMMWIVTANLGVLPIGILWYAFPLSMFEAFVASFIIIKIQVQKE